MINNDILRIKLDCTVIAIKTISIENDIGIFHILYNRFFILLVWKIMANISLWLSFKYNENMDFCWFIGIIIFNIYNYR